MFFFFCKLSAVALAILCKNNVMQLSFFAINLRDRDVFSKVCTYMDILQRLTLALCYRAKSQKAGGRISKEYQKGKRTLIKRTVLLMHHRSIKLRRIAFMYLIFC